MRGLAPAVYLGTVLGVGTVDVRAQEASTLTDAPTDASGGNQLEEVVVTGYRAALQSALALKRDAGTSTRARLALNPRPSGRGS